MFQFPTIPPWNALHPLLIHFPIALLLIAPLFVLVGAILKPRRGKPFLYSAFILMLLGTAAVFFAASTGEAAGKLVKETPQIETILDRHENLAEAVEIIFSVLTALFALLLFVPRWLHRELSHKLSAALLAVFLIGYASGAVVLSNTAHHGGLLVHQLGVHAPTAAAASATPAASVEAEEREH